jgi:hypothetical protein
LANAVDQPPPSALAIGFASKPAPTNYSFAHYLRCPSPAYGLPARALSRRSLCWRTPHLCRSWLAGEGLTPGGAGLLANAVDQSPPRALAIGFASKPAPTNYSFAHCLRCPSPAFELPAQALSARLSAGWRHISVGAGLLANALCLSMKVLNVPASSRASALLQVIRNALSPAANTVPADYSSAHCRARRPFSRVNASVLR